MAVICVEENINLIKYDTAEKHHYKYILIVVTTPEKNCAIEQWWKHIILGIKFCLMKWFICCIVLVVNKYATATVVLIIHIAIVCFPSTCAVNVPT